MIEKNIIRWCEYTVISISEVLKFFWNWIRFSLILWIFWNMEKRKFLRAISVYWNIREGKWLKPLVLAFWYSTITILRIYETITPKYLQKNDAASANQKCSQPGNLGGWQTSKFFTCFEQMLCTSIKEIVAMVDETIYDEIDIDMVIIYLSPIISGLIINKIWGVILGLVNDEREGERGQ